jgi:hypothetical protein
VLCHAGVPSLNAYGSDLAGTNPLAIENLDSDGDSKTNGQEINTDCTLPGDASSVLPVEDLTWGAIKVLFR